MNTSIGTKITFAAVTFVLATAAAVGVAVYSGSSALLVEQETENLGDQNHIAAARLISRIEVLSQDARFLAGTPPIQGVVRTRRAADGLDPLDGSSEALWRSRLATIFTQFLHAKPDYLQVRYIGIADGGRELVRVERSPDDAVRVVEEAALQKKGQHPYFRETTQLKADQIYLSEVTLNREQGRVSEPHVAVMRAALPVYAPDGELFGLVIINMDFLSALNTVIDHSRYGGNIHFYVTNDRGDYLLHPNPAQRFGFELGRRHQLQSDYPKLAALFDKGDDRDKLTLHPESVQGGEALSYYKAAFDPLHPERFIGLALAASYQEVIADSIAVRNHSAALTLLLITIGGGLAWLFSRLLTRPLHQITQAAEQVATGHFDVTLPVNVGGELGLLARGFDHMAKQVHERGEALRQRADDLARANKELDQFAYVTSHDLKAPLRAIANLSQWIEEDLEECITPDTRKQMDLLRGRVHRMEALIEGILEYSRVGRVSVDVAEVDIGALLAETVEILAPPEDFSVEISPGMPVIGTARVHLSQVFANLIGNAIKYRERDDGHIQVSVKDEGDFYRFSVADDGPGIPEAFHDKVFQIFQTLQARDTLESTGVGLTLVKKIVEEQGGNIELESAAGEGATFHFSWPKQAVINHAA